MDYRSFLVIIIITLCFICGCITAPAAESTLEGEGITDITLPSEADRVSLTYALEDLAIADIEGISNTENMTILQINADDMDLSGDASTWVLGVTTQDNETAILVYNRFEWRALSWPEHYSTSVIDTDAILSPTDLFAMQAGTIQDELEISNATEISLDLIDGVYKVYARNGNRMNYLAFDADSGELIVSE
jgi:hypothetical protein